MLSKLRSGVGTIHEQISIDRRETLNCYKNIRVFRDYAAGKQANTLTVDQQKMLSGVLGNDYCDNVCEEAVSEHTDRLELKRFTIDSDLEQKWSTDNWQKLQMDDIQQRTHRRAICDGNYCLMVAYNFSRQKIAIHREKWWDGYLGIYIGYDTFGDPLYAVKEWDTPEGRRRTVYYEGAIERYVSSGGEGSFWLPFLLPGDSVEGYSSGGIFDIGKEAIPINYSSSDGQPFHIPVVHFANPGDEFDNYGSSILDGGRIGAQDQINDIQYDIVAASRMTGYQKTWSKGFKLKEGPGGRLLAPRTGPGVHSHSDSKDAEWGAIEAGDPVPLISVYKMKVEAFCRATRTPHAAVTGNWPSGEALYRMEKPISGATKTRQKRFAPRWVELWHRCMEFANEYDFAGLDTTKLIQAVYSDAGDRDPLSMAMTDLSFWQAADAAVTAGMPLEIYLQVQGWGDDKIKGVTNGIKEKLNSLPPGMDIRGNPLPQVAKATPGIIPGSRSKASPTNKVKEKAGI